MASDDVVKEHKIHQIVICRPQGHIELAPACIRLFGGCCMTSDNSRGRN